MSKCLLRSVDHPNVLLQKLHLKCLGLASFFLLNLTLFNGLFDKSSFPSYVAKQYFQGLRVSLLVKFNGLESSLQMMSSDRSPETELFSLLSATQVFPFPT